MKTKKSIRFANIKPIFLVLLFIFNINIIFGQNLPTSEDATVTTLEDNDKVFSEDDFPYDDVDNHPLRQIWIAASAANGTLYYDENDNNIIDPGEAVSIVMFGKIIPVGDIPKLKFRPLSNENGFGYYFFDFKVHDGSDGYSDPHTMTIDVTPVNDAPSFTLLAFSLLLEVDEDSGPQTIYPFALSISAGPSDESGQELTFYLKNSDENLFSVQPEVNSETGTLTFTPAPNLYGTANIRIYLEDDGGTANGGNNSSTTVNFTITINPVNDPPTSADNSVTTFENSFYTFAVEDFPFEDTEGGSLMQIKIPTIPNKGVLWIDSNGDNIINNGETVLNDNSTVSVLDLAQNKLKYLPVDNENGTPYTTFQFQVYDGEDFSISYFMTINIDPVNSEPYFTAGPSQFIFKSSEVQTAEAWATDISPGAKDEIGQELTFHLTVDDETMFSILPDVDETTGTLTYTPASDADGATNINIYLTDNGGTANGGDDSSSVQNFSIMIIGTPVWGRNGENTILLNENDNIGIGTNTPKKSLHIFNNHITEEFEDASLRLHNYYSFENPAFEMQRHMLWDFIAENKKLNLNFGAGEEENPNPETDTKFTFKGNSMFGIGTDNPLKQLHITNENEPTIRLEKKEEVGNVSTSIPTNWDLRSDGSNLNFDYTTGDNYYPSKIKFTSAGKIEAELLNIGNGILTVDENNVETNGNLYVNNNVGIKTNNPIADLDVNGDINFSGDLLHNGEIFDPSVWQTNGDDIYYDAGNVGIGTTDPQSPLHIINGTTELLELKDNGHLYVRELIVEANDEFPDYVFEPEYKPMPLKELEQYIKENKHLPEVPTESDVDANGIEVAKLTTILLKKIEELTLYIIELQKEVDELKVFIQK